MGKDTHKDMLGHSQAKVELYGKYLSKYLFVITQDQHTTHIHLYDMFCGEGIYESEKVGSPIIALRELRKLYTVPERKLPKFIITFNDIDSETIEKLKKNINKVYINKEWNINFFNDDYLNLLPRIISQIAKFKNEKAIIFLDPKGYKEIVIEHIRQLLQGGKSEVLLFLPIRDMYRFSNMSAHQMNSGHEPLQKIMRELFPEGVPSFDSQIDFINKVRKGFKNILPTFYVDTFIIERDKGQFFCLFFFTSHIRGFEKMLDAKWEVDENEGRIWQSYRSEAMFSGSEILDIEGKLKKFLQSDVGKGNGEIYSYCLNEGFLPKHANEIFSDWQQKGILNVVEGNKLARKGAFYLSYNEYKNDPKKVQIKYIPDLFS